MFGAGRKPLEYGSFSYVDNISTFLSKNLVCLFATTKNFKFEKIGFFVIDHKNASVVMCSKLAGQLMSPALPIAFVCDEEGGLYLVERICKPAS